MFSNLDTLGDSGDESLGSPRLVLGLWTKYRHPANGKPKSCVQVPRNLGAEDLLPGLPG
jgi:hypothetical protein